ncbi:MAG: DUF362 domain-containing protein [Nitrososphaerota archaeon]
MKRKISRRDFLLIILSLGIGAIIPSLFYFIKQKREGIISTTYTKTISESQTVVSTITKPITYTVTHTITKAKTETITQTETKTIISTPSIAHLSIVRKDNIDEMVRRAIELVGGLKNLSPGKNVLIKPNVNSNDPYPATTNPEVIRSVIKIVKEYKPKRIIVADCSNASYRPTIESMKNVGIYQAAIQEGAEVIGLEDMGWENIKPEKATNWVGGIETTKILKQIDYLISVPAIKTHYIATYSMAIKNSVGLISDKSRSLLHSYGEPKFGSMLAEINLIHPPDFIILDGTKAFVTGGPFKGEVKQPNIIIATSDPIAADAIGLAILKYLGTTKNIEEKSVWEQQQIKRAIEIGLGISNANQLIINDENINEISQIKKFLLE